METKLIPSDSLPDPSAPKRKRGRPRLDDSGRSHSAPPRVVHTVTVNGVKAIDWSRTSADELSALLASPEAREKLNLPAPAPARPSSLPTAVPQLVNMANLAALPGLAQRFQLTEEETKLLVLARDQEKFADVCERAADELTKLMPGGFGRWDNLVGIVADIMQFSAESIVAIRKQRATNGPARPSVVRPFAPAPSIDEAAVSSQTFSVSES